MPIVYASGNAIATRTSARSQSPGADELVDLAADVLPRLVHDGQEFVTNPFFERNWHFFSP